MKKKYYFFMMLLCVLMAPSFVSAVDLTQDLRQYYKADVGGVDFLNTYNVTGGDVNTSFYWGNGSFAFDGDAGNNWETSANTVTYPHTVLMWVYPSTVTGTIESWEWGNSGLLSLRFETSGSKLVLHYNDAASQNDRYTTDNDVLNLDEWNMIGYTIGGDDNVTIFVNDSSVPATKSTFGGGSEPPTGSLVQTVGASTADTQRWEGNIDSVGVWTIYANDSFVASFYNSLTDPLEPPSSDPFLDIRIQDIYDDANLENLVVTLANGVSNTTSSLGVAHFENYSTQSFNVTDPAGLYFDYNSSSNPTENATSTYKVFGAFVNLSAFDVFGAAVESFNVSSGSQSNESLSFSTLLYLRPNASNVVNVTKSGWFDELVTVNTSAQDLGSYNLSGLHDNEFFFNASDVFSNLSISDFSINASNGSFSSFLSTSGGNVTFDLLQGYSYLFVINASGFAIDNITLDANASSQAYEFELFTQNSVLLTFYDEQSGDLIFQNVTVEYSDGVTFLSNVTNSSSLFVENIDVGTWTFDVSSDGYDSRQYFVTVSEQSTQELDVYLLNSSVGVFTTFTIKAANTGDVIAGSTVTMQVQNGSNWVTIDQKVSDAFGVATFSLVEGDEYRFIIETEGYFTKVGEFTNVNVNYIVPLTSENSQDFTSFVSDFSYTKTPSSYVGLNETVFSLTVSSPSGVLEWFGVVVSVNGSQFVSNVTSSPSGGTASVSVNLSGFAGETVYASYFIQSANFDNVFVLYDSWLLYDYGVQGNYTFSDFMSFYSDDDNGLSTGLRVFILVVVAALLAISIGLFAGYEAGVLGASTVFLVGGVFGWLNLSIMLVVVALLLGLLFVGGRR